MPCEGGPSYDVVYRDDPEAKKEIDKLSQMLCFLCGSLQHDGLFEDYTDKRIKRWWKQHQKSDIKRVSDKMKKIFNKDVSLEPEDVAEDFIKKAEKVHSVSEFHKEWFLQLATDIRKKIADERLKILKKEVETEQKRRKGLKKLTKSEKLALGIKNK